MRDPTRSLRKTESPAKHVIVALVGGLQKSSVFKYAEPSRPQRETPPLRFIVPPLGLRTHKLKATQVEVILIDQGPERRENTVGDFPWGKKGNKKKICSFFNGTHKT